MQLARIYPTKNESFTKFSERVQKEFIGCVGGDELSARALTVNRWISSKLRGKDVSNFFGAPMIDVQDSSSPVYVENKIMYLNGTIGSWDDEVNIYAVREAVKMLPGDPLKISISSPGGSIAEGYAIANYLTGLGRPIWTYIDGFTLSMGALLALVGERRYISRLASVMFHRTESMVIGNVNDLRAEMDVMERLDAGIIGYIVARTKMTQERVEQGLQGEMWLTPDEAVVAGVATEIAEVGEKASESQLDNATGGARARASQNKEMLNRRRARAMAVFSAPAY